MRKIAIALILILFLVMPVILFAQESKAGNGEENVALLEYFEDSSGAFRIVTADGKEIYSQDLYFGYEIPVGATIVTEAGDYAEVSLDPNGSIIKVAENTNFKIVSLQKTDGSGENAFSIAVGKFRAVAGRLTGNEKYVFKGPSAVCGVRGTDLGMEVLPGQKEIAFVLDGLIDYTNAAGKKIEIGAGMMADALAKSFKPIQIPPNVLSDLMKGLEFKKLKPESVPGHKPAPKATEAKGEAKKTEAVPPPPPAEKKPAVKKEEVKKKAENAFMAGIYEKLREILGMEIGSVTIDGVTYSKAVLQPHFTIGKLKMALYLPIIYKTDMLNPDDWYHPKGNNEWSFGTDQSGWGEKAMDFLNDLALKIRYVEWGKQRDKFFFKIGNLNDITIGHGLLMRNYANDTDFPSVRRVGLNLGIDFNFMGFEAMVNDIGDPEIFGGRLYFRPIPVFPMAVGMTVLTDVSPASELPDPTVVGDPMLFNLGLDLDFPIIETDFFSIVSFADIGGMLPWLRYPLYDANGVVVQAGPQWDALLVKDETNPDNPPSLKNYGIAAGLFGNIAVFNWRLEYRNFNGTFRPAFYNQLYDRERVTYVTEIAQYLENPNAPEYQHQTMGVYGEGGFAIKKLFSLEGGYFWPWYMENGKINMGDNDMLHLKFSLEPGVIPVVGVYGSISYDRTKFIPTLLSGASEGLSLFDANTVVSAELVYPVAPTLDVSILYTTTLKRDSSGAVILDDNGNPTISTTVSIETKVHF